MTAGEVMCSVCHLIRTDVQERLPADKASSMCLACFLNGYSIKSLSYWEQFDE